MAENKTQETEADVAEFLSTVSNEQQRADGQVLVQLLERVSGFPAKMWGPKIVGFGRYHYRYDSGREGDMCRIGFSPRKADTTLYLSGVFASHAEVLARLGKHKVSGGCLHIKRLSDVNLGALEELCAASLAETARKYPSD